MEIEHFYANQRDEWNNFVSQESSFSLLQSWDWGEIKEKLGWKTYRISIKEKDQIIAAAQILIKPSPIGLASCVYIPRGPIGDWLNPEVSKLLFSEIHRIARLHQAVFLKIEPPLLDNSETTVLISQFNFRPSQSTMQPRATIILDLTPDLDTLNSLIRKQTRRKIKDAAKKGIEIRVGCHEELPSFYELLRLTCKRAGFFIRPYQYYLDEYKTLTDHGHSLMLVAMHENKQIAADIIYIFGTHAAFFHQASSNECGNLNPNSLLVWETIKLLKEKGCCTYDLWGIADEIGEIVSQGGELPGHERTDGLWGVYQFKSGFCKNVVYYTGAYDFIYKPVLYKFISSKFFAHNLERLSIFSEWMRRKPVLE